MKWVKSYLFQWTLLLAGILLVVSIHGMASEGSFREKFIENYKGQRFKQQAEVVKENKDIIPEEVRALIEEAMQEDKGFEQRMYLLDIANAMASMHKHWNDDEGPLKEVEPFIRQELEKEKQRVAKLMKWKKEEKFLGNFVMKAHKEETDKEGLAPVLYPHWLHRIFYQCKVCHDDIFTMKRWVNGISQKEIIQGRQCGVCHNGKIAFGADSDEQCEMCHIAGKPEARRFHDVTQIDHEKIKEAATSVGAEWRPEELPEGKLPVDRFKFIDWLELERREVFKPVASLDKEFTEEIRDNFILFESTTDFVKDVVFSHNVHSTWIKCSTCHPAVFKEELGGNDIKMADMSKGSSCGHCHGKVSFTFADCLRCHNQPKGAVPEGVLVRKKEPESLP
jgi:c(7)-type cytochrome triheme protein